MPASKAQQKAVTKYMKAKYDEIKVRVEKGQKDTIQAHAEAHSESVNGFIGRAITETIARDSAGGPQQAAGQPAGAGVVSLPFDALEAAQRAAETTGETVGKFLARAVETQVQQDRSSMAMGINPATGDKLEQEA